MTLTLPAHDKAIDITAETCPMTFVRTRLALDALDPGQILLVRLAGADPLANVPPTRDTTRSSCCRRPMAAGCW
jgi:TusA-related sulfurtransferase